jgi:hypothetical protein
VMSLASLTTARIPLNVDSSGVAIQGCDPVAFFTDSRPFKGNQEYQFRFRWR